MSCAFSKAQSNKKPKQSKPSLSPCKQKNTSRGWQGPTEHQNTPRFFGIIRNQIDQNCLRVEYVWPPKSLHHAPRHGADRRPWVSCERAQRSCAMDWILESMISWYLSHGVRQSQEKQKNKKTVRSCKNRNCRSPVEGCFLLFLWYLGACCTHFHR